MSRWTRKAKKTRTPSMGKRLRRVSEIALDNITEVMRLRRKLDDANAAIERLKNEKPGASHA